MIGKGNKLYAIVNMKCPRCHEGKQFRSPLLAGKVYDMHEKCPVCGQRYEIEPGFFWGAMYIGYALSSGALLIVALLCLMVFQLSLPQTYFVLAITFLIGFFYNARLARSIWLNMYVHYDKNWKDGQSK